MSEFISRIPEDISRFASLVEASKRVIGRERRESGIRDRTAPIESDVKEKIPPPDPDDITAEHKERAKSLELRFKNLQEMYKEVPGEFFRDTTDDYLLARLEPGTPDYVKAHLTGIDGLLGRALFEPRLLDNVERAMVQWEKLNGTVPVDFVNDGLSVDGEALLNLRDFVSNLVSTSSPNPNLDEKVGKIMKKLKARIPELMEVIKELE